MSSHGPTEPPQNEQPGDLPGGSGGSRAALAAVVAAQELQEEGARRELLALAAWAQANAAPEPSGEGTARGTDPGAVHGDHGLQVAGPGTPLVSELALMELAAALGCSMLTACRRVGEALELVHRLPEIKSRVLAGEVPVWRGRRIAQHTVALPAAAATHVDQVLRDSAHSVSWRRAGAVVEAIRLRFDPDEAARLRAEAAEQRYFVVETEVAGASGVVGCGGVLDLEDALDLEAAIRAGADALAAAGSTEPLDVRRAKALGNLARGVVPVLDPPTADHPAAPSPGRTVDIVVHVADPTVARCQNTDTPVTVEQVASWVSGAARVRIQPVLDLAAPAAADSYEIPARLARQVRLRDSRCVFPFCTTPSAYADLDHITPYGAGGPTSSANLAPLCRRHHRAKTHGNFQYERVDDSTYRWRLPSGAEYLRDRQGTREVRPPTGADPTRASEHPPSDDQHRTGDHDAGPAP